MIKDNLYWHVYRPKTLKNVIVVPRIKDTLFDADGVAKHDNFLLYGPPGMGKSTLAAIMCQGKDMLKVNASYNSSVDDLRESVYTFCRTYGLNSDSDEKVVWLDEFDGVSKQYQEALRAFIEDNLERVSFIATCNDITKVIPGMLSRFKLVDFTPANQEESDMLISGYTKRLTGAMKHAGHDVSEPQMLEVVRRTFPDFRNAFNVAEVAALVGGTVAPTDLETLFKIATAPCDPAKIMSYVVDNWTNRIPAMIKELGRPFAAWVFTNKPKDAAKTVDSMLWADECGRSLQQSLDPTLTGVALICRISAKFVA